MDILIQASQLILSLSILVLLHEMGHFIPAKLFKTKVEKFYLFFDPWFSLFKFKKGETEYGIGWLPLGGYVKIAGMIDESMDKEQMKKPPQPWEFRSKPAWQRLIIMLGGVTVNVILGVVIYAMVIFTWGTQFLPTENAVHGIYSNATANIMGLESGDKILAVNGSEIKNFNEIQLRIVLDNAKSLTVNRNGEVKDIAIPSGTIAKLIESQESFIEPAILPIVDQTMEDSPAEKAGLQSGDQILAIDGIETPFFQDVVSYLQKNKNKEVKLTVNREGHNVELFATTSENGTIGFANTPLDKQLAFETRKYGFFESLPAGAQKTYDSFVSYLQQMKLIFMPETGAYKSLGGFLTIGKAFSPQWDWQHFWSFTAFLSIILAIMNLLPIPALDGGHVLFLLVEIISGKKPREKFLEYAQIVGIILLLALMILANGNDILKLF